MPGKSLPEIGSVLVGTDEYLVEAPLDEGGVGAVFRVRRLKDGQVFVAKVLSGHRFVVDDAAIKRFRREIEIQKSIVNKHLIAVVDVAEHNGLPVPIMEYAEGGSMYAALKKGAGNVPIPLALEWMRQIAIGVATLHEHGIVHRDLTPKNVLIRGDGTLAIADFGIARRVDDPTITTEEDRLGSLIYISAAQRTDPHNSKSYDDVFSLGQVFFHVITGLSPHGTIHSAKSHRDDCPGILDELVSRMRSFDPHGRPPDGSTVLAGLDEIVRIVRELEFRSANSKDRERAFADLRARQERHLETLFERTPESKTVRTLARMFERLGPFLVQVLQGGNWTEWFKRGTLRLEVQHEQWDSWLIDNTLMTNRLGGLALIRTTGTLATDIDESDIQAAFTELATMSVDDAKAFLGPFGFVRNASAPACERCGVRLTTVESIGSLPRYEVAFCESCGDRHRPHCGSCGRILRPVASSDEWGLYTAVGCEDCKKIFDDRAFDLSPWEDWVTVGTIS